MPNCRTDLLMNQEFDYLVLLALKGIKESNHKSSNPIDPYRKSICEKLKENKKLWIKLNAKNSFETEISTILQRLSRNRIIDCDEGGNCFSLNNKSEAYFNALQNKLIDQMDTYYTSDANGKAVQGTSIHAFNEDILTQENFKALEKFALQDSNRKLSPTIDAKNNEDLMSQIREQILNCERKSAD